MEQPPKTGGCSQGGINLPGEMSERGLPIGVCGPVDFSALELSALFRPGLDRLRELGDMRRLGVDRQAHAVL